MIISANFIPSTSITFHTVQDNYQLFYHYCNKIKQDIIIDLSNIEHCDSAGLAFLLEAKRICFELNINCNIINIPKIIVDLAEFYGIKNLLYTTDNI